MTMRLSKKSDISSNLEYVCLMLNTNSQNDRDPKRFYVYWRGKIRRSLVTKSLSRWLRFKNSRRGPPPREEGAHEKLVLRNKHKTLASENHQQQVLACFTSLSIILWEKEIHWIAVHCSASNWIAFDRIVLRHSSPLFWLTLIQKELSCLVCVLSHYYQTPFIFPTNQSVIAWHDESRLENHHPQTTITKDRDIITVTLDYIHI